MTTVRQHKTGEKKINKYLILRIKKISLPSSQLMMTLFMILR
jgi:hypothetical protein